MHVFQRCEVAWLYSQPSLGSAAELVHIVAALIIEEAYFAIETQSSYVWLGHPGKHPPFHLFLWSFLPGKFSTILY